MRTRCWASWTAPGACSRIVACRPRTVSRVVHATTLFTNALIERKGAVTALVTTAGFRDILQIGRERRYELYDLQLVPPAPLVPRELRLEVPERVKADGTVLQPARCAALEAQVAEAVAMGAQSVAVLFLHSDLHPAHEAAAAALIKKRFPQVSVTASHAIVREVREYERGSTIAPMPMWRRWPSATWRGSAPNCRARHRRAAGADALQRRADPFAEAQRAPVQLLESGPAAGGLAAAFLAGPEEARVLAFDMGGTTAKLCVVEHGEPEVVFGFEAARQARFIEGSGLPIRIAAVDLIEIGAGGGSIARRDALGLLKVGPDSAGSRAGTGLLWPRRRRPP